MHHHTNFSTIHDQVSAGEWQTRLDLAACCCLMDKLGMTDLI
jgi:hypothetical protein